MNNKEIHMQVQQLSKILGFKVPLDGLLMMIFRRPVIDVVKLNDRLASIHQCKDKSLERMLLDFYGQEALDILNNTINHLTD